MIDPCEIGQTAEQVAVSQAAAGITTTAGAADANSLATQEFADAYWQMRGNPVAWSGATEAVKHDALRRATFYLCDVYGGQWRGIATDPNQALCWPRSGVIDGDDGFAYDANVIPTKMQEATCEIALRIINGVDLMPDLSVGTGDATSSTVSVGPLSISETFQGGARERPEFPAVRHKLRGLLTGFGGGGLMVRLTR